MTADTSTPEGAIERLRNAMNEHDIRVGVHTGEVEFVGSDARGLAVHASARVMSVGGPNEVLVSSTTYDLLEASGLNLEEAGTHEMKGLPGARRVFRCVPTAQ